MQPSRTGGPRVYSATERSLLQSMKSYERSIDEFDNLVDKLFIQGPTKIPILDRPITGIQMNMRSATSEDYNADIIALRSMIDGILVPTAKSLFGDAGNIAVKEAENLRNMFPDTGLLTPDTKTAAKKKIATIKAFIASRKDAVTGLPISVNTP